MGRTIPSFTLALMEEESEWRAFRNCLDRKDRGAFDEMFVIPKLYIFSCMSCASPVVVEPIFLSILFHHYTQLAQLISRVERITDERYDTISP
jgi:hypothetical protein